jgi:hypothetical protein
MPWARLALTRDRSMPVTSPPKPSQESVERPPLGQRLFDNVFLLLALGLLIMFVVYTGWGAWELLRMPPATLP